MGVAYGEGRPLRGRLLTDGFWKTVFVSRHSFRVAAHATLRWSAMKPAELEDFITSVGSTDLLGRRERHKDAGRRMAAPLRVSAQDAEPNWDLLRHEGMAGDPGSCATPRCRCTSRIAPELAHRTKPISPKMLRFNLPEPTTAGGRIHLSRLAAGPHLCQDLTQGANLRWRLDAERKWIDGLRNDSKHSILDREFDDWRESIDVVLMWSDRPTKPANHSPRLSMRSNSAT